jgi:hypothetical protein
LGEILLSGKHEPHPRSDDRDQITTARQAAEALFTSKPPVSAPSVSAGDAVDETTRKPRVLSIISPPIPVLLDEPATLIARAPPPSKIRRSQFARIRAWVKYGMTVAQVAQVCGVTVADIECILRHI